MRALILHPTHASPKKPGDAGEFKREAIRFAATVGEAYVREFDNRAAKPKRRAEVERLIWETAPDGLWDIIAFFGHGLKHGIQTGHDMRSVSKLAEVIALRSARPVLVELYACDAARDLDRDGKDDLRDAVGGDGGFADMLRDALSEQGVTGHVDAHAVAAHTTWNPYVRRFWADGEAAGTGGDWLVAPGSPKWRAWRAALKGPMRFRFPFMSPAEIDAAL